MKRLFLLSALTVILFGTFFYSSIMAEHHQNAKFLRHVVAFKFKAAASEEAIQKVVDEFAALPKTIPQIKGFEWGTNVSPETHDKGFTHCFTLTFTCATERDAYLVHPDHKKFGSHLGPILEDVFVIDYWTQP